MSQPQPSADTIRALLKSREENQDSPGEDVLVPVYGFLSDATAYTANSGPSLGSSMERHWFCKVAPSEVHTEAATYLLFLFAFDLVGTAKEWIVQLDHVLRGCAHCARGFCGARRTLGAKYLSRYPAKTKVEFFNAIDTWLSSVILLATSSQTKSSYSAASPSILSLPPPLFQLLLGEPSLLQRPEISQLLELALEESTAPIGTLKTPAASSLGLTAGLVFLLQSPSERLRLWAIAQLPACAREPLSHAEWLSNGIGAELQAMALSSAGGYEEGAQLRWEAIRLVLETGVLSQEALERGLLEGERTGWRANAERGMMAAIAGLLGGQSELFPKVLHIFTVLLNKSPTQHVWLSDPSSEWPIVVLSDLLDNPSLQLLLSEKTPEVTPLGWLGNYLRSVYRLSTRETGKAKAGIFSEVLAKASGFCFATMQHVRFSEEVKAKAAKDGLNALSQLHRNLGDTTQSANTSNEPFLQALYATLDIHASTIVAIALRPKAYVEPVWAPARDAARDFLAHLFEQDGRNIDAVHSELAEISFSERSRAKKAAAGKAVADPVKLTSLPTVAVRQSLWVLAYDELSSRDVDGVALFMRAVVPFAHLELLDRGNAWSQRGLEAVVDSNQWITSVRSINKALKVTRESFAPALESLASHSNPLAIRELWKKSNASNIAIRLLLSPASEVHDPVISLIQHSFDDVDDRADCFRCLLRTAPDQAMDGLASFLRTFISVAQITSESCSLAKWMVRCFTDVLDALCSFSGGESALLQNEAFLADHSGGKSMMRRVGTLWSLMTESLALVFKRTAAWAPYYENEVMVDWMRDALIFGRHMTETMRGFEAAALGNANAGRFGDDVESPVKMTVVGQKMVRELEKVLRDLVSWIRLTDVETLHQTFELVKTLLERINRSRNSKSSITSDLKWTIEEIDKFCRRDGKAFRSRLSDDLLSELSDLIAPFDDSLDEIQYIKSSGSVTLTDKLESVSREPKKPSKNAFEMMMPRSSKTTPSSSAAGPPRHASAYRPSSPIDVDAYDDFFNEVSSVDLADIERKAIKSLQPQPKPKRPVQPPLMFAKLPPGVKNPVLKPKPKIPSAIGGLQTKVMKDLRREHVAHLAERRKVGPVITPRPTAAPVVPNKVLAPTGIVRKDPPKPVTPADSGSSASESSDEETGTMSALTKLQKSPARPLLEKRQVKVLQNVNVPNLTVRGAQRQNAHRTRLRLRPDLGVLHRHILTWDPDFTGALAPQSKKLSVQHALPPLTKVPRLFKDPAAYEAVMLPLFIQEQWASFQKERDFPDVALTVEISNRFYVDEYIDLELTMDGDVPFSWRANETDVLTFRRVGAPGTLFAKVQMFRRKFKEINMTVRVHSSCDVPGLSVRSKWQMRKAFSLGTATREFAALKGMPYYEDGIVRDIMGARCSEMPTFSSQDIKNAMSAHDVNEPQAKAILGAMKSEGFVLIQGPPGTGKTKTISGLVGKFLSERATPINAHRNEKPTKQKLLVCAPSNAAIDEVAKRLKDGVRGSAGELIMPNIIRIGHDNTVNVSAKDIALDYLVEQKVNADLAKTSGGTSDAGKIQADLELIKQQSETKTAELSRVRDNDAQRQALEAELHSLRAKRISLGQAFTKAKDEARAATRHLDGARRTAREKILAEADVICCTLSGAGQESIASFDFGTVIIDEAAQAIEVSCLIPLKYRCTRCIMVGDPKQLPPTVLSTEAQTLGYNQSLFVRIAEQRPNSVHLLSIQYRMHPEISQLPSKVFYNSQLHDGPNMSKKTVAAWHGDPAFGPYRFFNVEGQETQGSGTSTKNTAEALVAVDLFRRLELEFGLKVNLDQRIGVITMYKDQLQELKRAFTRAFGESILSRIDFQTVDGFQGQEKDIIILSCVRSGANLRTIGFLKDERRMNVALTRAKSSLFIIGNAATLERSDERWRAIVNDARTRGCLINHDTTTFGARTTRPLPSPSTNNKPPKAKKPSLLPPDLLPPKTISAKTKPPTSAMVTERPSSPSERPAAAVSSTGSRKRPPSTEPKQEQPAGRSATTVKPLPAPAARPPGPPPPRNDTEVLFRQKKKKKPNNAPQQHGPTGIKQHIHHMTTGQK